jgi:two-component system phosphate regulon sensor histidine kinase PhoR
MRPRSTFIRLFLGNLLAMVAILSLVGLFAYKRLNRNYQAEARRNQDRLARVATEHFQGLWPLRQSQVDEICKRLLHDRGVRLTVIASNGAVLGDSEADPRLMANHRTPDRPEVLAALAGKAGIDERRSDTIAIQYRYVAMPLTHGGQVVASVRLAMPVKTIAEGETVLRNAILWSVLAGIVAAVLLGLLTSWIWYAPLRRITRTAKQIASGDLTSKAGIVRSGGLGELAGALNELRDSLGKYLGQIASQHQDFQAVLANLMEGVVATDANGRIVLMNRAAGELFSVDHRQAVGKPLQSAVRVLQILECHEQAAIMAEPIHSQFEIDTPACHRALEVHGAKVPPGPSSIACLLVIRDVTEMAAAAAMKAQFAANASHELRTPLATIRAAVDSLASAEPGNKEELTKLAGMLDRHVARLEEMTRDLLDLHRVESAKFQIRLEDIALGDLADWVRAQFASHAREKGLVFSVSASVPGHRLHSDRKLLELILSNLVDNAIKFTPAGGSIECAFEATAQGVSMRVNDTGCGIQPEDQPRVFDRFYQSDAVRSGDSRVRGTGLGLAIVKHAAERLGAKVELQSAVGQGTTVSVFLAHRKDEGNP